MDYFDKSGQSAANIVSVDFMEMFLSELIQLGKIILSGAMTLPYAINREQRTRIMGLRTYPLVGMGTCAFILIAQQFIGDGHPDAEARIVQGILSGIGFVGGGAILKNEDRVVGTASAAGIWITGGIGTAVAYEAWGIVLALTTVAFLTYRFLTPFKVDPRRRTIGP